MIFYTLLLRQLNSYILFKNIFFSFSLASARVGWFEPARPELIQRMIFTPGSVVISHTSANSYKTYTGYRYGDIGVCLILL